MLVRNEIIIKWTIYAATTILCFFIQGSLCLRITLWGVIPFLFPMLAAIPATFESPVPATIFSLCLGIVCDSLLPEPIPCFYTLIFPIVGLVSSILAQSLLPAGFLCSLIVTAVAFLFTDLFRCLLLSMAGNTTVWTSGLFILLREFLITLPFLFPVTLLYRAVFRKTHMYD